MPSCNLRSCWSVRGQKRALALCIIVAMSAIVTPSSASVGGFVGSDAIQTGGDTSAAGTARAFIQNATAAGTINRLSVYLDARNTASQVTLGLYANSSSRPGRRLAFCSCDHATGRCLELMPHLAADDHDAQVLGRHPPTHAIDRNDQVPRCPRRWRRQLQLVDGLHVDAADQLPSRPMGIGRPGVDVRRSRAGSGSDA